jgi:bifunctional DNA-binding transcriptional regulator/antitoxin component of YhaV-PrlF toxin-antitoxin module
MKEKIVKIDKGKIGVALPKEYLRHLELIPGAEVEIRIDKEKNWIVLRPLHGEDFFEHFKESMESMA